MPYLLIGGLIMKIELTDDRSILLYLEKSDLETLHLDVDTMLYSDENTREILHTLYNEAKEKTGFEPLNNGNAMIEVLPFEDGSCIICFSFPKNKTKIKIIPHIKNRTFIYEFYSLADFESFLTVWDKSGRLKIDALYKYDDTYRAVINTESESARSLISEYSVEIVSPLSQSETEEFWEKVNCNGESVQ
jgi:negative regulator of genetic competence, sporulation and motility